MRRFRKFLSEVWRVRWMLAFALAIVAVRAYGLLPEESVTLRTLYRPAIGAMGFVVAHVGYQQSFPYLDMRDLLRRALGSGGGQNELLADRSTAAVLFLGSCILRGAIYAAFVLGAMLAI
ncbi:MAG: hypothetical protein Q8Q14_17010 [Gemmatimonadales bacterium]|nr:hypothetical protein [Gemmatimonadales bacterium]